MKKIRLLPAVAFFGALLAGSITLFASPKETRSETERRLLAEAPELTSENVLSGGILSGSTSGRRTIFRRESCFGRHAPHFRSTFSGSMSTTALSGMREASSVCRSRQMRHRSRMPGSGLSACERSIWSGRSAVCTGRLSRTRAAFCGMRAIPWRTARGWRSCTAGSFRLRRRCRSGRALS